MKVAIAAIVMLLVPAAGLALAALAISMEPRYADPAPV